ncbi:MAG: cysteine desulfurase [Rhodospirillales bacterium]|nr:cysteine desulfurase [Rhodospirillales bacterium]
MSFGIYLDHNATTPLRCEAAVAMRAAMEMLGNPSSVHRHGRNARRLIEDARATIAGSVGAEPADVVFTSGGTESNALALCASGRRRLVVTAIEHASVLSAGDSPVIVPVDDDGIVDLVALDAILAESTEPAVVSVMLANNETGAVQPVAAVGDIAHRYGALFHCDAAQAAGKIAIDMRVMGIDLLSWSAHKLGGPAGIGALAIAPGIPVAAMLRGGGQERGRRAGSENLIGIVGFAAATETAAGSQDDARLAGLREAIERRIRGVCPSSRVFAQGVPRLPNTTCLTMPGVPAETQVIAFDLAGISVSAGAACASGKVGASHVLRAMGVGEDLARSALRVSTGWTTVADDVDRFCQVWTSIYAQVSRRESVSAGSAATAALDWDRVGKVTE